MSLNPYFVQGLRDGLEKHAAGAADYILPSLLGGGIGAGGGALYEALAGGGDNYLRSMLLGGLLGAGGGAAAKGLTGGEAPSPYVENEFEGANVSAPPISTSGPSGMASADMQKIYEGMSADELDRILRAAQRLGGGGSENLLGTLKKRMRGEQPRP